MKERRRFPRQRPSQDVWARVKSSIAARIVDVSEGGLCIECSVPLRPSSDCDVTLPSVVGILRLRTHVMRCRAEMVNAANGVKRLAYRCGLSFRDLTEREQLALAAGLDGVTPLDEMQPSRSDRLA